MLPNNKKLSPSSYLPALLFVLHFIMSVL